MFASLLMAAIVGAWGYGDFLDDPRPVVAVPRPHAMTPGPDPAPRPAAPIAETPRATPRPKAPPWVAVWEWRVDNFDQRYELYGFVGADGVFYHFDRRPRSYVPFPTPAPAPARTIIYRGTDCANGRCPR